VAGEDDSGIYLIPPTGGPERKLAARSLGNFVVTNYGKEISWSPDGKFLAYIDLSAKQTLQPFSLALDTL
jgi:hypothetical protein